MDPDNYMQPTKKRLSKAQLADEERMQFAIFTIGIIPFYTGKPENAHRRRPDGKCDKDKCHKPWPCPAAVRQLNAHRG